MRRIAAPLAAVLCGLAIGACGDGAEPGAPKGATLVLDFQPNAVHSGIYAAKANGDFEAEGLDLEIREPSSSADSAKLLEAGRADFAIMDVNDLGIARERGLGVAAIAAIVQRPLASVIAADRDEIRTPADLAGKTVGVTGVPSDDAVLDTVLADAGLAPGAVERKTIGFESVPLLAAGRVDAATAFWNAEGVTLAQEGVPVRELRVDGFGAPRYPELVVAVRDGQGSPSPEDPACRFLGGLRRGYRALDEDPGAALDALLDAVPELDAASQRAQMGALLDAAAFSSGSREGLGSDAEGEAQPDLDRRRVRAWARWAASHGIVESPGAASSGFEAGLESSACAGSAGS